MMGRCLRHGYVDARCCDGFEPTQSTGFLRGAVDRAMNEHVPHPGPCCDRWQRKVASETPDTPSTEARPHDPFCVLFGINDLMQGRESGCTCATRRSDTPSTEARPYETADPATLAYLSKSTRSDTPSTEARPNIESLMVGALDFAVDPSHDWGNLYCRDCLAWPDEPSAQERCTGPSWRRAAERAIRQEAADTSGLPLKAIDTAVRMIEGGMPSNARLMLLDLAAALRGATERPLDVDPLCADGCRMADYGSPATTTPDA